MSGVREGATVAARWAAGGGAAGAWAGCPGYESIRAGLAAAAEAAAGEPA